MRRKKQHFKESSLIHDLHHLLGYVSRRHRRQLGLLLVLMIVSSLGDVVSLGAVIPFLGALSNTEKLLGKPQLQPFLTLFQIEAPSQLVTALALVFVAAVIVANALRIVTVNAQTHFAASIASDISCQLYNKTLLQPYEFHVKHNSSDLINLLTADTRGITSAILMPLLALITNSFSVLALTVGLFFINWQVALITAVILGSAYVGLYRWRRNQLKRNSRVLVQSNQQQIKVVQESLGGIRDVLVGGAQDFFQSTYQQADSRYRHAFASNIIISQTPRYVIEALAMTAVALMALILGRGGNFSLVVPVLGSLVLGANRLLPALQQVFTSLVRIQGSRASLTRVLQGLQRPLDPLQVWVPSEGLPLKRELRFEHVWFRYSDETGWVLQELNFSIAAKTTVGFVGSTGSGKSTTVDLVLGLLNPQKGMIWLDNQPLRGERLRQWQQSVAHVPQSIFLADATLRENIAFGIPKEQIDFDRVRQAARSAQIDEFIQGLPTQYETYVGERGVRLSGGQRQRIGIARALYRQASVIVFDEATSALDNATEKEVMAAIGRLSRQFTIILIAHRLSTLEQCDQIVELRQGKVIATGSYQSLIKQVGSFQDQGNESQ